MLASRAAAPNGPTKGFICGKTPLGYVLLRPPCGSRIEELITYADAGHAVAFEQADAFLRLMVDEIVPATYDLNAGGQQ